jgi:hypothetical protein
MVQIHSPRPFFPWISVYDYFDKLTASTGSLTILEAILPAGAGRARNFRN